MIKAPLFKPQEAKATAWSWAPIFINAAQCSVHRKLENWEKHQANIQNANCGACKEVVPTEYAHGLVMLFLKDTRALFNPLILTFVEICTQSQDAAPRWA